MMALVVFGSPAWLTLNTDHIASVATSEFRPGIVVVRMADGSEFSLGNTTVGKITDRILEAQS